ASSGELNANLGGPTIPLSNSANNRRTVYAKISRHDLDGLLRLFDFPDANITSEKRIETTVPQQQLFILNSPFVQARAKALAARVQTVEKTDEGRLKRAYLLVYGRPPDGDELKLGLTYVTGKDTEKSTTAQLSRWERYAQVLLAGNEFLYI